MKPVERYEDLAPLLAAQLRPGVVTNAFAAADDLRREIAAGTLRYFAWPDGLLLRRERDGFGRLSFYLRGGSLPPDLRWGGPAVTEIAARPRDVSLRDAAAALESRGFSVRLRRLRLALSKDVPVPAADGAARPAGPEDLPALAALLRESFDPLTGCLPTAAELEAAAAAGQLLCVGPAGQPFALLHWTPARGGTQLRHLATAASHRRAGAATDLLAAYRRRTDCARSLVWTGLDNGPARSFYEKNGYTADGWTSVVLYRPEE